MCGNIFKTKKIQMKVLLGQTQIALSKQNTSTITTGQLKQPGAFDSMIHQDQGFKFLRAVRGSPPYFEKEKKDIFAMIRQLRLAFLFYNFSSAETQWIHPLRILGKLVDDKTYTDAQLENFNWEEKSRLIQCDLGTRASHFDFQVHKFLQNFLLGNSAPIGRTACEEARRGNSSIKQQVRDIRNKSLNKVEISAQEAVYILLQLPMRKSSRQVVFINTSPLEDRAIRVQLLK